MQAFGQFYQPNKQQYQTPKRYGLKYKSVTFESEDKTRLHGWFVPATDKAIGTVLHFHGNAQNLTAHFSFVKWLPKQGFNVFLFDYRGYGKSEGTPTRTGVHKDAIAALKYVQARDDVDSDRLLVLGQSLGGAVAISAIASTNTNASGICGIAVESTFDSYAAIAKEKAPAFLVALAISDKLSPNAVVKNLSPIPIVFIHGTSDRVVPYRRGKSLFDKASKPKAMWTIKGGRHTEAFTTYGKIYQAKLIKYFRKCIERKIKAKAAEPQPN